MTRAKPRRIGGISTRPDSKAAIRQAIAANLQLIANADAEIDKFCRQRDIAIEAITKLMKEGGFTHEEAHGYVSRYVEEFTRASRHVRTKDFYEKLKAHSKNAKEAEETFLGVAEITITTAQKFLGEKELAEVCDATPAKSKGFVVRVEQVKTEVKRKPPTPHEE